MGVRIGLNAKHGIAIFQGGWVTDDGGGGVSCFSHGVCVCAGGAYVIGGCVSI